MSFPRYPRMRDSGVEWLGEVPQHWAVVTLGRLLGSIDQGWSPVADDREPDEGEASVLRLSAIKRGEFHPRQRKALSLVDDEVKAAKSLLSEGDFLLTRANTPDLVGDCAIARGVSPKTIFSDLIYRLNFKKDEAAPDFMLHALCSSPLRSQMTRDARGSSMSMAKLSHGHIRSWVLARPPYNEQLAIAAFLDGETAKIDGLIEAQRRLIELLGEKRQAVISHAVTKGLDPAAPMKASGVAWLGEVPAHWEVVQLRRVLDFLTSGSRGWAEHYADDGALFVRIGNLTRGSIDLDLSDVQRVTVPEGAEGERTKLKAGDLLFSITAYLGSVAVVPEGLETAYVSQHVALARLKPGCVLPRWAGWVVVSDVGQTSLKLSGYGGTKIQLSLDDVAGLILPLPPLSEQAEIVRSLEARLSAMSLAEEEASSAISLLQERRAALVSAAVTGKIDVRGLVEAPGLLEAAE